MRPFFQTIVALLNTIRLSISGHYISDDPELLKIKRDIYNLEIPSRKEDQINLKKDRDEACNDYKKAYKNKLELVG